MCKYWKIDQNTYATRKYRGFPLEKCLAKDITNYIYDHLGNKFKTEKDMAKYWGIDYKEYQRRKQSNWSIQERLEGRWFYDTIGNKFKNQKEMCDYWGIDIIVYRGRKRNGWRLEQCLGIVPRLHEYTPNNTYLTNNLFLINIINVDDQIYCNCILDDNPILLHQTIVENICREYNTKNKYA